MDLVDHDVANGLWFAGNGLGLKTDNRDHAPILTLVAFSKHAIAHMPRLKEWFRRNPYPKDQGEAAAEIWGDGFASVFLDEGWHLLWRGSLFTQSELAQVAEDLRRLEPDLVSDVAVWPENTRIGVYRSFAGRETTATSWASLAGKPNV